ncbi:MAG: hypothetical protein JWN04_3911 [Myxococcaceae bacterium]|nr:hypothetical protein [Myxococcaceae bacterium]
MALEVTSRHLRSASELLHCIPIKSGFVERADWTSSYATRLQLLLEVLSASFQASAEKTLMPTASALERLQNISTVQYGVVQRFDRAELLVSVNFDSSWETYFHNLVDNVGALLDLIFSHCEDFDQNTCKDGYERFSEWIRRHQVRCGLYYNAQPELTVDDIRGIRSGSKGGLSDGVIPDLAALEAEAIAAVAKQPDPFPEEYRTERVRDLRRLLTVLLDMRDSFPSGAELFTPLRAGERGRDARVRFSDALGELLASYPLSPTDVQRLPSELLLQLVDALPTEFVAKLPQDVREALAAKLAPGATPSPAKQLIAKLPDPIVGSKERPTLASLGNVQGNILTPYEKAQHGCLVLIHCPSASAVHNLLSVLHCEGWLWFEGAFEGIPSRIQIEGVPGLRVNMGITAQALERSGLAHDDLVRFPREFREGMAARAGLLGDIGVNHPDRWQELEVNWPLPKPAGNARVPVSCVDVVLTMQCSAASSPNDHTWSSEHPLYPCVDRLDKSLGTDDERPHIVRVEPLRRRPSDHFKLSKRERNENQPAPDVEGLLVAFERDRTALGELVLGYDDRRNEIASSTRKSSDSPHCELFKDSTFAVVRKLEQNVAAFDEYVERIAEQLNHDACHLAGAMLKTADDVRAMMVGLDQLGRSLAAPNASPSNDFDYTLPGAEACPLYAHARRAFPRERSDPRILRRSFSYGSSYDEPSAQDERGLMFMAYNASIAQQFEVIQRWVMGGNRTGLPSSKRDLLVGVHGISQASYSGQTAGGKPFDIPAPTSPLVRLRWGMYLFVPSKVGVEYLIRASASESLRNRRVAGSDVGATSKLNDTAQQCSGRRPDARWVMEGEAILKRLERICPRDGEEAQTAWQQVFEEDIHLEAMTAVTSALRSRGQRGKVVSDFTPTPYGLLVTDYQSAHRVLSDSGKNYSVSEYAVRMGESIGLHYLGIDTSTPKYSLRAARPNAFLHDPPSGGTRSMGAFKRAADLSAAVIKDLTDKAQFVDVRVVAKRVVAQLASEWIGLPKNEDPILLLEYFITVSRYCFLPHPPPYLVKQAKAAGAALRKAYAKATLTSDAMANSLRQASPYKDDESLVENALIGSLVGFAAPAVGNIVSVLARWLASGELERLARAGRAMTEGEVRRLVSESMMQAPQPPVLYRTLVTGPNAGKKVVIALASACASAPDDHDPLQWIFGGHHEAAEDRSSHGCPARSQGMSAIAGVVASVLACHTLRSEGAFVFSVGDLAHATSPLSKSGPDVAGVPPQRTEGPRQAHVPAQRGCPFASHQRPPEEL